MAAIISAVRSAPAQSPPVHTPGRQSAVFLDRDGVFNSTDGFVNKPEDLDRALFPGAPAAIARLTREFAGPVVIVTNQGGVDLGHMKPEVNQAIQERLAERIEEAGGRVDAIYFCPNGKKFQIPEGHVDGRKPQAGMFFHAGNEFGSRIDLADSYMIGDMSTDIAAAETANSAMTSILVETGFAGKDGKVPFTADHTCADINAAVDFILANER